MSAKTSRIPDAVRKHVRERDRGCVGPRAGLPGKCRGGPLEQNHIRPSHGIGMKSPSTADNLVSLCAWVHHRWATEHGPEARPLLIAWVDKAEAAIASARTRVGTYNVAAE